MNVFKLAAILLLIPALSFAVALYYESEIDKTLQSQIRTAYPELSESRVQEVTTEAVMFHPDEYGQVAFEPEVYLFVVMKYASLFSVALGAFLILAVMILARWSSQSRDLLAKVFPLTAGFSAVAIALATVLNGLLLVGAIYYGEAAAIQRVHYVVIAGVALGAFIGAFGMISALRRAFVRHPLRIDEAELPEDHPLIAEVRAVAEKLGATVPEAVILGNAPTFFAYEGPFVTADRSHSGRLLYLSKDLSEHLEAVELRAILAHEFAHFLGKDLDYTVKFNFGYRALGSAAAQLAEVSDLTMALARLPALHLLNFVLSQFAAVERTNSRERELEADKVAYTNYGGPEFARSLTKVVLLAPALSELRSRDDEVAEPATALTALLGDEKFREVEAAATQRQSHPFDTHPTLAERLEPLSLEVSTVIAEVTARPPFRL